MAEDILTVTDNAVVDTPAQETDAAPKTDSQPPALDYAKLVGENGNLAENWREYLPEDVRSEKSLDAIHNFETLVKSYVSGQRMIGAKKVAIPGENSSADDWNAFYKALGRPDKADDYTIDGVILPENIELDDELLADFRKFAHENGMSQKVFAKALEFDAQRVVNAMTKAAAAAEAERSETETKLKQEWGITFQQQIGNAQKALKEYGLVDFINNHHLTNNYEFIMAMAKIGAGISESRMPEGIKNTPSDIDSRLNAITGDLNHAYYNREHPQHDAAVAEVERLLELKRRSQAE